MENQNEKDHRNDHTVVPEPNAVETENPRLLSKTIAEYDDGEDMEGITHRFTSEGIESIR